MSGLRLTRATRQRYGLEITELPEQIADIRRLVTTINDAPTSSESLRAVNAGQLQAAALISAALALVVDRYREQVARDAVDRALTALDTALGQRTIDAVLATYADAFEARPVQTRAQRVQAIEDLLLIWLANENPAFAPMRELFDDAPMRASPDYARAMAALAQHFETSPPFGPDRQPLIAMLRSPAIAFPDSLAGQLAYIRERWGFLLGELLDRLLLATDILSEEERAYWLRLHGTEEAVRPGRGHGDPASAYDFTTLVSEREAFTPDREWHPRLSLIAKSVYVWLDQLSRRYGRPIQHLDQIPDEELDRLASWGINGLWLIGIWQRSRASEEIKRIQGNPEAAASAYAVDDYEVADDLGGHEAWFDLSERAGRRGLKLAADMVPNHMGIDSRWVIEHPDRFLSLSEPPYPAYRFTGPDLSPDPAVSIVIEDHYWDHSDAAVVFERRDRASGETRYIYHGNDGTAFPWNDTAQLDYLKAEVREQVIQTILSVARRFSIIRFDAAMVLTRQHIQRLWWPEHGSGGAIPSRAERSISREAFERAMPEEFWREVVDRVAAEGLDTLLLAEAFWLLEGYFVRTLGMHRVYNSAFMHMLRDERNAEYHLVMRNTLEFDPEILKRYVNFMSNPDEETAIDQFGKDDKYFGVCTLLVTLPGLPMFGHGQVEGLAEKYGMEYRRAYKDESVDDPLVARHEREIFPLLHRRAQFAEARDFLLYVFVADDGTVNEDVFAYSNGRGSERSLVIYHNRFASTAGTIRESVAFSLRDGEGRQQVRRTMAEGLGLPADAAGTYVTFRDHATSLEYVRSVARLRDQGLWVALGAYQRHVFLDFREVQDEPAHPWRQLEERLGGRGVPSLAEALDEIRLEPVHACFRRIASAAVARRLLETARAPDAEAQREQLVSEITSAANELVAAANEFARGDFDIAGQDITTDTSATLHAMLSIFAKSDDGKNHQGKSDEARGNEARSNEAKSDEDKSDEGATERESARAGTLVALLGLRVLGGSGPEAERRSRSRRHLDKWRLAPIITEMLCELGVSEERARQQVDAMRAVVGLPAWPSTADRSLPEAAGIVAETWLNDEVTTRAIGLNTYEGVRWLQAERFSDLVRLSCEAETIRVLQDDPAPEVNEELDRVEAIAACLLKVAEQAGYRADELVRTLRTPKGLERAPDGAEPSEVPPPVSAAPDARPRAKPREGSDPAARS